VLQKFLTIILQFFVIWGGGKNYFPTTLLKPLAALFLLLFLAFNANAQTWSPHTAGNFEIKYTYPSGSANTQFNVWTTASGYTYTVYNNSDVALTSGSGNAANLTTITPAGGIPADGYIIISFEPDNLSHFTDFDGNLSDVLQWGTAHWRSMSGMFFGSYLTNITASDIPDLSGVTSMFEMFRACSNLISVNRMNEWDVSHVTNMSSMFYASGHFNQDIGDWDVSSVTNMSEMFFDVHDFNNGGQPMHWDAKTGNVTNMFNMFFACSYFNQDISNWDVRNVTQTDLMFEDAYSFNQNLGKWTLSALTNGNSMFAYSGMSCENYTNTLNGWAANPNRGRNIL
jgi:surface protein